MATIYICANNETLADGRIANRDRWDDSIDDAILETCNRFEKYGEIETKAASIFQDWHGGKFDRCGSLHGGVTFGYRCGWAATLEENPSDELRKLVEDADEFLTTLIDKIGAMEAEEEAEFAKDSTD